MKQFLLFSFFSVSTLFTNQLVAQNCDTVNLATFEKVAIYPYDSIFEAEGMRNGPAYKDATLFYPTNNNNKLTSIIFVPGFGGDQSNFALWAPYLVSRGYVCMTIGTNSLYDSPKNRALGLIDAMETIRQENIRAGSPVYGRLDTNNIAVAGWSMGGGGAQLAAGMEPRVKAVIAFTPWLDNALTPADLNHNAPVLILSGEKDPTAPPAQHATKHYNYTPATTPKLLYEIKNGNHSVALYPNGNNGDIGNSTMAWIHTFLDKTPCYCPFLADSTIDQSANTTKYLTNLDCENLPNSVTENIPTVNFQIYPNPAGNDVYFKSNSKLEYRYQIYSIDGRLLLSGSAQADEKIVIETLPQAMYVLRVGDKNYRFVKK